MFVARHLQAAAIDDERRAFRHAGIDVVRDLVAMRGGDQRPHVRRRHSAIGRRAGSARAPRAPRPACRPWRHRRRPPRRSPCSARPPNHRPRPTRRRRPGRRPHPAASRGDSSRRPAPARVCRASTPSRCTYSAIGVEPTKLTASTPGCCSSASTATLSPLTTLNTPGGSPASASHCASNSPGAGIALRGLEDEGVAADQRHRKHPQRHHGRKVERRDAGGHAQRLAQRVAVDARADVRRRTRPW